MYPKALGGSQNTADRFPKQKLSKLPKPPIYECPRTIRLSEQIDCWNVISRFLNSTCFADWSSFSSKFHVKGLWSEDLFWFKKWDFIVGSNGNPCANLQVPFWKPCFARVPSHGVHFLSVGVPMFTKVFEGTFCFLKYLVSSCSTKTWLLHDSEHASCHQQGIEYVNTWKVSQKISSNLKRRFPKARQSLEHLLCVRPSRKFSRTRLTRTRQFARTRVMQNVLSNGVSNKRLSRSTL